jgi:hypothetical protein
MFKGFMVRDGGLYISHLQYANDILFLGEPLAKDMGTLKTILCCFKLPLGLKVNLFNRSVMGVNVSIEFLRLAERFLRRSVGSILLT